jgi:hypothetical protein
MLGEGARRAWGRRNEPPTTTSVHQHRDGGDADPAIPRAPAGSRLRPVREEVNPRAPRPRRCDAGPATARSMLPCAEHHPSLHPLLRPATSTRDRPWRDRTPGHDSPRASRTIGAESAESRAPSRDRGRRRAPSRAIARFPEDEALAGRRPMRSRCLSSRHRHTAWARSGGRSRSPGKAVGETIPAPGPPEGAPGARPPRPPHATEAAARTRTAADA